MQMKVNFCSRFLLFSSSFFGGRQCQFNRTCSSDKVFGISSARNGAELLLSGPSSASPPQSTKGSRVDC